MFKNLVIIVLILIKRNYLWPEHFIRIDLRSEFILQKIILHFDEINLKGRNRRFFEKQMIDNLKARTPLYNIRKEYGYAVASADEDPSSILNIFPGVYSYAVAEETPLDVDKMTEVAIRMAQSTPHKSFSIDTRRHNKRFPLKSPEINGKIGAAVQRVTGVPVNIKHPELPIVVEIAQYNAYIYSRRNFGAGGLPVGSTSDTLCLLSGGIDSPVAAYMMMKRGSRVHFVHFLNTTKVTAAVKDKISDLAKRLGQIQGKAKLFVVPFEDIQRQIVAHVDPRYRMLVYRRFMLKIANRIAEKSNINALVTGDSLSQVASQTIENLRVVYEASELPVLHPLIGFNKLETIRIAEKIGTMDISSRPYDDLCSSYVPKHPSTKTNLKTINLQEADLKANELIQLALEKIDILKISPDNND